jgi:NhaA family Na+:H+ antiporter
VVIAVFYTDDFSAGSLLLSLLPLALFGLLVQKRIRSWWLLLPLALATWVLVHESGVHATVAGVLLGFTVPVVRSQAAGGPEAGLGLAEHFEHRFRPISAGIAVPVFAFSSAGVAVGGLSGLAASVTDSVAVGIAVGLVVGKAIGITGATWLVSRFTRAELDESLGWPDVVGLSLLGGIGFTVSLLITELAFGLGTATGGSPRRSGSTRTPTASRTSTRGVPPRAEKARCRPPGSDVPSRYTREEVVRNLHAYRTREVAVR